MLFLSSYFFLRSNDTGTGIGIGIHGVRFVHLRLRVCIGN
jgi:hypothetical protein